MSDFRFQMTFHTSLLFWMSMASAVLGIGVESRIELGSTIWKKAKIASGIVEENKFSITVSGIDGKPIHKAKIVVSDADGKRIGTYRSGGDHLPTTLAVGDRQVVWLNVSKPGFLVQRFQVNLSQAGWSTVVFLGKAHDAYYENIDAGFPSGRMYPYHPISGVVLVCNTDEIPTDFKWSGDGE